MTKAQQLKNEKFWQLSKKEQRVAVAEDVIRQIKCGFYKAVHTYLQVFNDTSQLIHAFESISPDLQTALKRLKRTGGTCNACGIGTCFLSIAKLGSSVRSEDVHTGGLSESILRRTLRQVFSPAQITLIECAFEYNDGFRDPQDYSSSYKSRVRAANFGMEYSYDDEERMIAIMENIVKNGGTFRP